MGDLHIEDEKIFWQKKIFERVLNNSLCIREMTQLFNISLGAVEKCNVKFDKTNNV